MTINNLDAARGSSTTLDVVQRKYKQNHVITITGIGTPVVYSIIIIYMHFIVNTRGGHQYFNNTTF